MTNSPGAGGPDSAGNGTAAELRDLLNQELGPVRDYLATMGVALAGIDDEIRSLQRSGVVAVRSSDPATTEDVSRQIDELRQAVQQPDGAGEDLTARVARLAEYLEMAASHIETIRNEEGGLAAIRTDVSESVIAMTNRVTTEVEALRASVTSHLTYVSAQIDAVKSANDTVAASVSDTSGMQREILAAVADVQDTVAGQPAAIEAANTGTLAAVREETSSLAGSLDQLTQKLALLTAQVENGRHDTSQVAGEVQSNRQAITTQIGELRTEIGELASAVAATIAAQDTSTARTTEALAEIMTGLTSIEDALGELAPVLRTAGSIEERIGDLDAHVNEHLDTTRSALIGNLREVAEAVEGRSDQLTNEIGQIRSVIGSIEESAAASRGKTAEDLAASQAAIIEALNTGSSVLDRRANERIVELHNRITVIGTTLEETTAMLAGLQQTVASQDLETIEARTAEMLESIRQEMATLDLNSLRASINERIEQQGVAVSTHTAQQVGSLKNDLSDLMGRLDLIRTAVESVNEAMSGADVSTIQTSVMALAEASAGLEAATQAGITTITETLATGTERSEQMGTEIAELKAALVGVGRQVSAMDVTTVLATLEERFAEVIDDRQEALQGRLGESFQGVEAQVGDVRRVVDQLNSALAGIVDGLVGQDASAAIDAAKGAIVAVVDERARNLDARTGHRIDGVEERLAAVIDGLTRLGASLGSQDVDAVRDAILAAVGQESEAATARSDAVAAEMSELKGAVVGLGRAVNAIQLSDELASLQTAVMDAVGQVGERAGVVDSRVAAVASQVEQLAAAALRESTTAQEIAAELTATRDSILNAVGERVGAVNQGVTDLEGRFGGVVQEIEQMSAAVSSLGAALAAQDLSDQLTVTQDAIVAAVDERARTLDARTGRRLDQVEARVAEQVAGVGELVQADDHSIAQRDRAMAEALEAIAESIESSRKDLLTVARRAVEVATSTRDDVVSETEQGLARVMDGQAELQERLAEVSRSSVVALDRATSIANQLVPNIDGLAEVAMERTAAVERRLDQLLSRLQPDASTIGIAMADAMRQAVGPLLSDVLARVDALTEAERQHSAEVAALREAVQSLGVPVRRGPDPEGSVSEPEGRRRRRG